MPFGPSDLRPPPTSPLLRGELTLRRWRCSGVAAVFLLAVLLVDDAAFLFLAFSGGEGRVKCEE